MRLTDELAALLEQRLRVVGVDRRGFLRTIVALTAAGIPAAAAGPQLGPGERLAKDQILRTGGGGYFDRDPSSHDFGKDSYGGGHLALFAGLLQFDVDFVPIPDVAMKVESNGDGSVWRFSLRRDARWSNGVPCTAHDFVWSWQRVLNPATAASYATFFYDIRNAEAFNKGRIVDPQQLGLRARDAYTLEVTLEGPRAYFPVLTAFYVAFPAYRPAVEQYGDTWTEPGHIVSNGPFRLESWTHGQQLVLAKNPHYHGVHD